MSREGSGSRCCRWCWFVAVYLVQGLERQLQYRVVSSWWKQVVADFWMIQFLRRKQVICEKELFFSRRVFFFSRRVFFFRGGFFFVRGGVLFGCSWKGSIVVKCEECSFFHIFQDWLSDWFQLASTSRYSFVCINQQLQPANSQNRNRIRYSGVPGRRV